jgi:hypothetical protein
MRAGNSPPTDITRRRESDLRAIERFDGRWSDNCWRGETRCNYSLPRDIAGEVDTWPMPGDPACDYCGWAEFREGCSPLKTISLLALNGNPERHLQRTCKRLRNEIPDDNRGP